MKTNADLLNLIQLLNANVGEAKTKGQKKLVKIGERLKPFIDDFNDKEGDYQG